jgi:hypothetical protein
MPEGTDRLACPRGDISITLYETTTYMETLG